MACLRFMNSTSGNWLVIELLPLHISGINSIISGGIGIKSVLQMPKFIGIHENRRKSEGVLPQWRHSFHNNSARVYRLHGYSYHIKVSAGNKTLFWMKLKFRVCSVGDPDSATEDCVLDCPKSSRESDNCVKNTCCGPSKVRKVVFLKRQGVKLVFLFIRKN